MVLQHNTLEAEIGFLTFLQSQTRDFILQTIPLHLVKAADDPPASHVQGAWSSDFDNLYTVRPKVTHKLILF